MKLLFFVVLIFSINVCATVSVNWVVSAQSPDAFKKYAQDLKNELEKETQGRFKIQISTLDRSEKDLLSLVRKNQFDAGLFYSEVVASFNPVMWVLNLPLLFRNDQHIKAVLNGPLKNDLLQGLQDNNLIGLSFVNTQDFKILAATNELKMSDLYGRAIRTTTAPTSQFFFKELGAVPLITEPADNRRVLDSKLIATVELSVLWLDEKQLKATPFLYSLHGSRSPALVVYNLKKFINMSISEQEIIKKMSEKIQTQSPILKIENLLLSQKDKVNLEKASRNTNDNFKAIIQESMIKKIKEYPTEP